MTEDENRDSRPPGRRHGLVIVNTGNGKGKTTAALGVVMRSWGRGMRVCVVQFLKNAHARFGETMAAGKLGIDWLATGDGWTWKSRDIEKTKEQAVRAWAVAQEIITSEKYDVLVLDEFTYLLHYGWLDTTSVLSWLAENRPPTLHLIITGRHAPPALIEFADLVTEMNQVKHPMEDQKLRAQPGIEF